MHPKYKIVTEECENVRCNSHTSEIRKLRSKNTAGAPFYCKL